MVFESYSYNKAEVELHWLDPPITLIHSDPRGYKLPEFILSNWTAKSSSLPYTAGIWDQLIVEFTFKRQNAYYIVQVIDNNFFCENQNGSLKGSKLTVTLKVLFVLGVFSDLFSCVYQLDSILSRHHSTAAQSHTCS